ncbi:MAG: TIM barrel protein, partial [Chloroflexota bacterium]
TPEAWIESLRQHGYRAAYSPFDASADSNTRRAYVQAAAEADIVIAEVGAWSNPISPDDAVRKAAIDKCQQQLALADDIGARCCVNIAGARGEKWDGPYADNFSAATFALIVETVRNILDSVKPKRAFYSLEPMPCIFPDSADSYLDLIRAIDRPQFGVHLDPVNMISSPRRYFNNTAFLHECFDKLGGHIKSIHAKDIIVREPLTVHLDEVRPGLGTLDYVTFLRRANQLDADMPFMLEHLPMSEYAPSAEFVRQTAISLNITL